MDRSNKRHFIKIETSKTSRGTSADVDDVGGKGRSLLILSEKFNIPRGIILTTHLFDDYLEYNRISKILSRDKMGESELKELNRVISDSVIPEMTLKSLERELYESEITGHRLVVRSSATVEDSEKASFAGRFKTVINVIGMEQAAKAIKEVYDSTYGPEAVSYCKKAGIPLNKLKMAVVIQELIVGSYSGVMFTRDPVNFADKTIIEAISGLNEGMVSGKITPSKFVFDNKSHRLETSINVPQKRIFVPGDKGGTCILDTNPGSWKGLSKPILSKLARMALSIEETFGLPQDIEWTIKGKIIYILQSRSITTGRGRNLPRTVIRNAGRMLSGYPASAGSTFGEIKRIGGPGEPIPKGIVLVIDVLDTEYSTESVNGVKAIITQDGGVLSHAAIVARELGIPCVVGIEGIMEKVSDGDKVVVDGTNGVVYLDGVSSGIRAKRGLDYSYLYDFDRMSKLPKRDIYYEEFDDRVIYYSYSKLDRNELKRIFGRAYREGKEVKMGGAPKNYIFRRYLAYKHNKVLNGLTESAIEVARSCNPEHVERVSENLLEAAAECMIRYDKISGERRGDYLERLSKLMYAEWCYTLVNELICEGYGITSLQKKFEQILGPKGQDITYLLERIDSKEGINTNGLSPKQRDALNDAVKYYRELKRLRLESYPKFKSVNAAGAEFNDKVEKVMLKLLKNGKNRDRVKEEAMYYIDSYIQRRP
jgi:phosphohistidine swiveling domain-containing protein